MRITLTVIAGPHEGLEFMFARHDTFLVGRSKFAHFQLPLKDKYFSRVHFMIEVNPPQCRLIDMGSHNGTYINGSRQNCADLKDGDQIHAGHTILKLAVHLDREDEAAPLPSLELQDIPGYHSERELGKGTMGTVFMATRLADKMTVAIKIIKRRGAGARSNLDQFLKDAAVLTELNHPNLVRFLDMGEAGNMPFVVMEHVAGIDAAALLARDGPLAIKRAVRLVAQLLQALEYSHGKNVIHGDVKPANLLIVDSAGKDNAKLASCGLARIYQASQLSGLTITGDASAEAGFLPPERITNYRQAAPAGDQYAAAATLYNLLTGQFPFDLPTEIHRRFTLILQTQVVPIQQRRPDINPELAAVVHKALSRHPSQRFDDVASFRKALVKAVQHGP